MQRPDLTQLPDGVARYIELLEAELAALRHTREDAAARAAEERADVELPPNEPPTTIQVITISAGGMAKRTPRHLYSRQRRGGMGVFDLDAPPGDPPAFLLMADEGTGLVLLTNQGRIFRGAVADIVLREVRARGEWITGRLPLREGERLAVVVPDTPLQGGAYLVLVSERGQVRRIARQYLGSSFQPGTVLHDPREGGPPAAACWSGGADDLFLVTRGGQAIRFAERLVPVRGCLGMRVEPGDRIVSAAAVPETGGVFLVGADGKGTVREMAGFGANKAPGTGGKVAMKTDTLVGALTVTEGCDLFVISRLGKLIRFQAGEVPPKEGVVQGVNCMSLRADECVAVAGAIIPG
jgi:DNA gyrase subunit A